MILDLIILAAALAALIGGAALAIYSYDLRMWLNRRLGYGPDDTKRADFNAGFRGHRDDEPRQEGER
jgi:hypothetical protein